MEDARSVGYNQLIAPTKVFVPAPNPSRGDYKAQTDPLTPIVSVSPLLRSHRQNLCASAS